MLNINKKNNQKVALITGAAGLLGEIHSEALLELNYTLIITDINTKILKKRVKLLKKKFAKSNIFHFKLNVTSQKQIEKIHNIIKNKFGKLDVLINNVAIDHKIDNNNKLTKKNEFENFNNKQWKKEIEVGLYGYYLCCKIFGSHMVKKKGGIILNISSDLSVIAPNQNLYEKKQKKPVTYSVIKTGVIGLTKYLASYWGSKGVRVNALSPGGVFNNQNKKFVKKIIELIPMRRMLNRDEIKGSIKFLCSNQSSYLNGHNLVLDGGRSII